MSEDNKPSKFFFTLSVLVLFALSAGFQLWVFAALYHSGGSIHLIDPDKHMIMFEFGLSSTIFTFSLIVLYRFFISLWRGK